MSSQTKIFGPEVRYSESGTPTTEILYWTVVEIEPGKKVRVNIRTDYLTRLALKEIAGDPDRLMVEVLEHFAEDLLKSGWKPSEGQEIRVGTHDIEPLYKSWKSDARERLLADGIRKLLVEAHSGYELEGLLRNSDTQSWTVELKTPEGKAKVALPMPLVNEVLDAGTASEFARLGNMLWFGLGRTDLIFENRQ